MALSMPLNGLKEEDKEPLIELFVKETCRSTELGSWDPPAIYNLQQRSQDGCE
ncbi:chloride intracellular channel 4 (mitochondrial), isoform CRA_a [Mus musculus]|nr:chloride intracellular channel 4 (mitochondrial), isoform CRA_a [Mus musculus]